MSPSRRPICHILRFADGCELLVALLPRPQPSRLLLRLLDRARRCLGPALAALLGFMPLTAQAQVTPTTLPSGGQIAAGQATITQANARMDIQQTSPRAILNWNNFNIGSQAQVSFTQPSSSAVALNRVLSSDPSQIYGKLNANGQIFLINPNGVLFAPGSRVDVGSLVASTLSISNSDFLAGNYRFTTLGGTAGSILNQGNLTAAPGGYLALLAPEVRNDGALQATLGTVALAAGETLTLNVTDDKLLNVAVDPARIKTLVENRNLIQANGGTVIMSTRAADELMGAAINNGGIVEARGLQNQGGVIRLEGGLVQSTGRLSADSDPGMVGGKVDVAGHVVWAQGEISADGTRGGQIGVTANTLFQTGNIHANGTQDAGGTIRLTSASRTTQMSSARLNVDGATQGGSIQLEGGERVVSSARYSAQGTRGGQVDIQGKDIHLLAANVTTSGTSQGGNVRIGGDYQGKNPTFANSDTVLVNTSSTLSANATETGNGGRVIVWSNDRTQFDGRIEARGGASGGNGGFIEVSGKEQLAFSGTTHASAPQGISGQVLLDPKNITISDTGSVGSLVLVDPNPTASAGANLNVLVLSNGNIVAATPDASVGGATATGQVVLYNSNTGAIIATLTGSTTNDRIGSAGITTLNNGNYVVASPFWNNGAASSTGAVTWGNGSTGTSGVVSSSNSLVGSVISDCVGNQGVVALSNGNYVVRSPAWNSFAGAATWGDGSTGVSGTISSTNSLVGSTANDRVGGSGITALSNGNYVVSSPNWNGNTGAVTWGNGSTGILGTISASNSLTGSNGGDLVGYGVSGSGGVIAVNGGNYVVRSPNWNSNFGAYTWGNGASGLSGTVSAVNSLIGSASGDCVGNNAVTTLSNGNYVLSSPNWNNNFGAATWVNESLGTSGTISDMNSLIGSSNSDRVGSFVTPLSNGNYVVSSPNWNGDMGAATWANGSTGVSGTISAANSLIGSTSGDMVSNDGITPLSNGNYVVRSSSWNSNTGAATWGNGSTGVSGTISSTNSLVGSSINDGVGSNAITALSNGNYVVLSSSWNSNTGAATWGNGSTGVSGTISSANSLVGSLISDRVGSSATALSNGNYVVQSPAWNGSTGAVTWGDGSTGISGTLSAVNSLVGGGSGDCVGNTGIATLSNGNYVVRSPSWNSSAGAVTWGNGSIGVFGTVSGTNSLIGSTSGDCVGSTDVTTLSNGNYVVRSIGWNTYAGAVTWGNGSTGISGTVSAANSLLGTTANGSLGSGGIIELSNGAYLVKTTSGTGRLEIGIGSPANATFTTLPGGSITLSPAAITQILNTGTGLVLQANNDIDVTSPITATNTGSLTLQAGRHLTFNANVTTANGNLTGIAGDTSANSSYRDVGTAHLKINNGVTLDVGTGTATLVTIGGNFTNSSANAIATSGAGRWLLYAADPAATTMGDLSSFNKHYNQTYSPAGLPSYASNGNWVLYAITPVLNVTPGTQSITYGSSTPNFVASSYSGFVDGDTSPGSITGTATWSISGSTSSAGYRAAGNHNVAYTGGLSSSLGYQFADNASSSNELTVATRQLTVSGVSAQNKVYDGTIAATISGGSVSPLSGDVVTLSGGSGTFSNKNVGDGKSVTVSGFTLGGADAGNYDAVGPSNLTANITPASLTISGVSAQNKVYDGTVNAVLAGSPSVSPLASDNVSVSGTGTGTFANKNVGNSKTVTITGYSLTGSDAGNYTAATSISQTANITPASLTISGVSAQNKVYDGTVAAVLTGTPSVSPLSGDSVSVSGTATGTFSDKNVGDSKAVTATGYTLTGTDAGNYTAVSSSDLTANITPASLTISGISAQDKVYDGTVAAVLTGTPSISPFAGDNVSVGNVGTGVFADKNVGNNKAVTVTGYALTGPDAANYTVVAEAKDLAANITPKPISASIAVPISKVYDGNTNANLGTLNLSGAITGDGVAASGSGLFDNRHVGNNKTITLGSLSLSGTDASNYSITWATPTSLGSISPLASVAWTGLGGDGLWSNPNNWAGNALPDGNNILAVTIPTSASITFDGTNTANGFLGHANLSRFTNQGNFTLAAGTLNTEAFSQTAGSFSGQGTLNVGDSFSKSGGTFTPAGWVNINQSVGNLIFSNEAAIKFGRLAAPSGSIEISNTGGVSTYDLVSAKEQVSLTTHSPITIGGNGIHAGSNISLAAPTANGDSNITIAGNITSGSGAVKISAFGNITQTANTSIAGGNIAMTSDAGNIAVASTANNSVYAGGSIQISATHGMITASSASFSGATPTITDATAITAQITAANAATTVQTSALTTLATSTQGSTLLTQISLPSKTEVTPSNLTIENQTNVISPSTGANAKSGDSAVLTTTEDSTGSNNTSTVAVTGSSSGSGSSSTSSAITAPESSSAAPAGTTKTSSSSTTETSSSSGSSQSDSKGGNTGTASKTPAKSSPKSNESKDIGARLTALAAMEVARHQARTELYKEALEILTKDPSVANLPSCSSGISTLCIPAPQKFEPMTTGGAVDPQVGLFSPTDPKRKIALMFGNNEYTGAIPALETPIDDVEAVGEVLRTRMGYDVKVVKNATKQDIALALKATVEQTSSEDSVLIMYAGHGYQLDSTKQGFWIPVDGKTTDPKTWVSNDDIAKFLHAIPAKQLILVSDSCFSGTLTKEQKVESKNASKAELLSKRAVVAFSSGDEEPVSDEGLDGHSIFAYHFIKQLNTADGFTTASQVHSTVKIAVSKEYPQAPQIGGVTSSGHTTGGDYLFLPK